MLHIYPPELAGDYSAIVVEIYRKRTSSAHGNLTVECWPRRVNTRGYGTGMANPGSRKFAEKNLKNHSWVQMC